MRIQRSLIIATSLCRHVILIWNRVKPHLGGYFCTKGFFADWFGAVVPSHVCSWSCSQDRTLQSHLRSLYHVMNHTRQVQAQWTNCKYNTKHFSYQIAPSTVMQNTDFKWDSWMACKCILPLLSGSISPRCSCRLIISLATTPQHAGHTSREVLRTGFARSDSGIVGWNRIQGMVVWYVYAFIVFVLFCV
jgi:hypothetical protein